MREWPEQGHGGLDVLFYAPADWCCPPRHDAHTVFYLFFLLPSAFLSPLRPAIRAELSSNTSGWVVPVFSANLHEIRAYNRLAGMARGAVLLLLQVWGAECMAGMVLGTKLLTQCVGRGMGRLVEVRDMGFS